MMNVLRCKLLHPEARLPLRKTHGAVGYDLCACHGEIVGPGCTVVIDTGVAIELSPYHAGFVHPRSGLSKRRIDVALGTIDSDYTGPIGVIITNNSIDDFVVKVGDRIAQLVITECCTPELIAVDALTETARGGGGFGSTGVSS